MRRKIGRKHKRCPWYPSKVTYRDAESAARALAVISEHPAHGDHKPTRWYLCPCGGYHLTSQPEGGMDD